MQAANFVTEATKVNFVGKSGETLLNEADGWDSFCLVQLCVALEGEMGRALEFDEIEGLVRLSDVQKLLTKP